MYRLPRLPGAPLGRFVAGKQSYPTVATAQQPCLGCADAERRAPSAAVPAQGWARRWLIGT